jgi:predicted TIM-barrel fold metal-dependent hydrolase
MPALTAFVAMDPWALPPQRNVAHLHEMAERGARGVKLHPVLQKFAPNEPRLHPVYQACTELGLTVLSHTGPARDGAPFAEVPAFAPMLAEFPGLTVVLAHLGGGKWQDTLATARAFPQVAFDLCEIIEWAGAPGAPTPAELGTLIREIGPERIVLGSDYPWYEPAHTAELVDAAGAFPGGEGRHPRRERGQNPPPARMTPRQPSRLWLWDQQPQKSVS